MTIDTMPNFAKYLQKTNPNQFDDEHYFGYDL